MGPALLLGALALAAATLPAAAQTREERVLVFTKTAGFRHESIPAAVAALQALAERNGLILDHTEDADVFTEEELGRYGAVVFANTTGDVLDERQQQAFERYVEGGGGYMGIHAASDTEYDWPWYGALVGAWFKGHPPGLQTGTVTFADPLREGGPRAWRVTDEFYNFQANPRPQVTVLATLDEGTYSGGEMGRDHPIAWCRTAGSGRSWYTGLGHRAELYADPTFLAHLERGLLFAVGRAECG